MEEYAKRMHWRKTKSVRRTMAGTLKKELLSVCYHGT